MDSNIKSRRKSTITAVLLVLLLISSCQSKVTQVSDTTEQLILNMRNSDVKWDGTFVGLLPEFNGPTLALQKIDEPIEPLLVEALLDEERYVAAHVLLTDRTKGSWTDTAKHWNGLSVHLYADGSVSYEGNDRNKLHQQWIEKLANSKE